MKTGDQGGFTLLELMIAAVLGAVVVGAAYQIMLTSQRAMTVQTAELRGQQNVRAGIDLLTGELRELSGPEGDLLSMASDQVTIRAMRAFGLVCGVNVLGSPVIVKKIGRFFTDGDSVVVLADNDPNLASDDTILSGAITGIDTTLTCTGADTAQAIVVPALITALANDTVRIGAPVRAFTVYTYGLYTVNGEPYLARQVGATISPLVGPLSTNGVSFAYLDSFGNVTATPSAVARIEVTLRSQSQVLDQQGHSIADSLTSVIHLRN